MSTPVADFSYSGDPSDSPLDAVRFLLGDTDPASFFLNDTEINFLLQQASTAPGATPDSAVVQAAGAGAETIAAELSREISYSADGVSISADTLAAKFYTVAEKIRTLTLRSATIAGPDVGGILFGETYDSSLRPLVFSLGMHDIAGAGWQDAGGSWIPPSYTSAPYVAVARQAAALTRTALARR